MEVMGTHSLNKKNNLTHLLPLALLAIFILLFNYSFQGLFERWTKWDEGLSHGLLVNAVFIYLLFKSLPWAPTPNSTPVQLFLCTSLALLSVAWLVFRLANIYILEQLSLLALLIGLYSCSYGWKTVLRYRLLLLLPIFTIPVWEQLTDILVNLSGYVVGLMVQQINIPASIQGNSIFIPYGHIVIADGCSGLRYFEIALALAFIIGLLNNYNEKNLIPTLIVAAALGLFANWLRIFILVIVGYRTQMQSPLMANHEYFGWFLFALMSFPAIYFAPVIKKVAQPNISAESLKPQALLPLCILAIGPLISLFISSLPSKTEFASIINHNPVIQMPVRITAPENAYIERTQLANGVYIEVAQYQRLKAQDKLVPYIARLYSNEEWLADSARIQLTNHKASITQYRHKTTSATVLELQWFDVNGHQTGSLAKAKLLQIPAMVAGGNNFKIISLQARCDISDCSQAQALLIDSASQLSQNIRNN